MFGKLSRRCLLVSALLLFCCSAYSQPLVYDGPELPVGWYPIHETELIEWDEILTEQETQLTMLQTTLTLAQTRLILASESLETSGAELNAAEVSLNELGRAAGRLRSLCIFLGATTTGGVLFILATIFGNPIGD